MHHIETGDAPPIWKNPYRIPHSQKQALQEQINVMLEERVIEPVSSPWSFPLVLVQKKALEGESSIRPMYRLSQVKCCDT